MDTFLSFFFAACTVVGGALFIWITIDIIREYRNIARERTDEAVQEKIDAAMEKHHKQDQEERNCFQAQMREINKEAWEAVQEMVSTARDLAYMEQHKQ